MTPLRRKITLKEGVEVDLLFTPHLYSFKGTSGVDFKADNSVNGNLDALELYADIAYCAALNAWVLDGHGTADEFVHTRGDFHEWMMQRPKEFLQTMDFALMALTGKSLKDFEKEDAGNADSDSDKKKVSTSTIRRSRNS